jgi:hypothetical protein
MNVLWKHSSEFRLKMGRWGGSGKGERGKGKGTHVSNTSKSPYPLTFSQTTREVHTAYPNRIEMGGMRRMGEVAR